MSELPDTSCTRSRILFLADAHVNKVNHLFIHFLTIIIIDILTNIGPKSSAFLLQKMYINLAVSIHDVFMLLGSNMVWCVVFDR